ncbi:hypothetical protein [Lentibacillus amyloliquefaciens]|uniref:Uncharacterized protein n=1 Tax=Lentibacillus amyloliquefaciens TaxID=1472767 RepID=A0A0U3WG19_9BACI|nr:hypothetical protein [Lentibacillus amyloliquefaciens]ALX48799.1 hypothetical protein AOX59_09330 [Lentibacillus amyloliquefaciens]
MQTLISLTNGLSVVALLAFIILVAMVSKEGQDERAQYMGYKLYSFLFTLLFIGLSLIVFITGWQSIDYVLLRVFITTLMSITIVVGLVYWLIIRRNI